MNREVHHACGQAMSVRQLREHLEDMDDDASVFFSCDYGDHGPAASPIEPVVSAVEPERDELERTEELFRFLQGQIPEGYKIAKSHIPKLTADQAWTVIWFLGNQYWEVPDFIERCGVCGDLYDSQSEGECLDFGKAPYHFCDQCSYGDVAGQKRRSRLNPDKSR